ncbi:small ligand-binding sensory domain FIST [Acidovorax soli]|uniref:Small ligand-binding sensory domain FIST n=1 Tax=Acidovorax soli TaxID=592050 RepID=A0A7X0PG67_9BURK|nr:FIST N-terminal domain-containing protein [Acidovorax soli]MBB6561363.1 small ligand-binding sensory domain FIST [Acidovorax soli]
MKLFPSGHATHPQWRMAAALALAQLRAQMALPEYAGAPTLGLLYITDHYAGEAQALLDYLAGELPEVTDWSGTVGVGVAANNAEYFDEPALSVMLLDVPPDQYRVFSGVAPLPLHPVGGFVAHTALVHADGHTPELTELLAEMAARTEAGYLFGGLCASRGASVQFAVGGDGNMAGQGGASGVFDGGLSGVAFGAEVALVSRVTQGCQPVGPLRSVTAAHENVVLQLDGEPALDVLLDTLEVSLDGDPQPALRKVRATLAGLVDAGVQPQGQQRTGHFGTDTRVRHIVGLDGARRGVALGDRVEPGMRLAFCQRNVAAARADLMRICAEIREELEPEELEPVPLASQDQAGRTMAPAPGTAAHGPAAAAAQSGRRIRGAIYVSCSGRGGPHFGGPSAELQIVRHALGDVPLAGFFAGGEIARHHLYGYTGVLTVFT